MTRNFTSFLFVLINLPTSEKIEPNPGPILVLCTHLKIFKSTKKLNFCAGVARASLRNFSIETDNKNTYELYLLLHGDLVK